MAEVRLQKVIAKAGVASRREAERMIESGRVTVNGEVVTQQGTRVNPMQDEVMVDGAPISRKQVRPIYLMVNKPREVVTTASDDKGRQTVMDLLGDLAGPKGASRVFHVGRLDYHSEGLLLLTNDGQLANGLTHPSNQVPRVYHARVRGEPSREVLDKLVAGVHLEDGMASALDAQILRHNDKSTWVEISVAEGRNRLVRRLFDAINHRVQRLIRVSYGGLELDDLLPGAVRPLNSAEVYDLQRWIGKHSARGDKSRRTGTRRKRAQKKGASASRAQGSPAPKSDARKSDAWKSDARKSDARKRDGRKGDKLKSDSPNSSARKSGAPKRGAPKRGAPKRGAPKRGAPKSGAPKRGNPKSGAPKRGNPKSGSPKSGSRKTGAPKSGSRKTGAPKSGGRKSSAPKRGAPKRGSRKSGAPKSGGRKGGGRKTGNRKNSARKGRTSKK